MNKATIKDIENVSFDILKQSKSLGVFPTPVDNIVNYCELKVDKSNCLTKIPNNYLAKSSEALKSALRKLRGAIDTREKVVYLDLSQNANRQKFVQLHEVGHDALPWQRKTFEHHHDDDSTLDLDTSVAFEAEANFFASGTLFQLDRFDEEASLLELTIRSPLALSKKFGGSVHATIRRYVERSPKRCALLVIEKDGLLNFKVRNYFQSASFTKEFGMLKWPESLGPDQAFIVDCSFRTMNTNGQFLFKGENGDLTFQYHFFSNSFNYFIMILPFGEKIKSRVKLVVRE
ncbi:MAG TPA: ImmA/IrrE family metallo-endopeptidase [Cyclobacteriaceae bacterium]|nr:ImmA/IrrE family metallo-endopeptidase [Cyclobacteriaceae bacterium]HRF32372.1 ImmA/IrrE family metallo-endopeptidase [Cyclobacteriaceae bacterium]